MRFCLNLPGSEEGQETQLLLPRHLLAALGPTVLRAIPQQMQMGYGDPCPECCSPERGREEAWGAGEEEGWRLRLRSGLSLRYWYLLSCVL